MLFGVVFVQFTALKNAIVRQLESSTRKSVINSLKDEVKAAASVAICLCFCLLRAVTNLPALRHTLTDSSGPGLWRLAWGRGWGLNRVIPSAPASLLQDVTAARDWSRVRSKLTNGPGQKTVSDVCSIQFQMGHTCLSAQPCGQLVPVKPLSERHGSEPFLNQT